MRFGCVWKVEHMEEKHLVCNPSKIEVGHRECENCFQIKIAQSTIAVRPHLARIYCVFPVLEKKAWYSVFFVKLARYSQFCRIRFKVAWRSDCIISHQSLWLSAHFHHPTIGTSSDKWVGHAWPLCAQLGCLFVIEVERCEDGKSHTAPTPGTGQWLKSDLTLKGSHCGLSQNWPLLLWCLQIDDSFCYVLLY